MNLKENLAKRSVHIGLPVAATIVVVALTLTAVATVAALKFSANNVTITSDDGQIESATISPRGTFSWGGVDEDVNFDGGDMIAYDIYVKLEGGDWKLLYSATQTDHNNIEDMGTTGYDKFAFEGIKLQKPNVIAYWQLEADEDGTENVNWISVKIEAKLLTSYMVKGVTKWKELVSASGEATFYLRCINEVAAADIGGEINPAAEPTPDT